MDAVRPPRSRACATIVSLTARPCCGMYCTCCYVGELRSSVHDWEHRVFLRTAWMPEEAHCCTGVRFACSLCAIIRCVV